MSNLGELNDANSSSLNAFGAFLGTAADFAGGIGIALDVLELVVPIAGGSIEPLFSTLQSMFKQVGDQIKAGQVLDRLRSIDEARGKAQAALESLRGSLDAKGSFVGPVDASWISLCREAIDDLSAPSFWLTVFVDEIYFNDSRIYQSVHTKHNGKHIYWDGGYGWVGPTPDDSGQVFTYIYVLQSWMYAEAAFLIVAAALNKNRQLTAAQRSLVESDANFLQGMHDTIIGGIQDLSPPPFDVPDLANAGIEDLPPPPGFVQSPGVSDVLDGSTVVGARIDYGAVERYSGMNSMATYQILNKDVSPSGTDFPSNPAVYKKYSIRLLKQQKDLYSAIGLPAVSKTIQQLGSITEHVPNYGDWSFNEICGIVGTTSLLAVKKLLQSTPPFDTPSLGSGFRALLNASG